MQFAILRTVRRTLPLWFCAVAPLLADVTIRYQSDFKVTPLMPPQVKEQMQKSQAKWSNFSLRMKDGKASANSDVWTFITDFAKQQITLVDTGHQTFSNLPAGELSDHIAALLPKMPEEAKKAMDAMKSTFESKKTGRTDTIQGVQAEEREMVLSIQIPMPAGGTAPAMTMKVVMQIWSAIPEEGVRNPAIRELMAVNLWSNAFMNPAEMMQKMTASLPGMGDALKSMTEELSRNRAVMLRTRTATYMPLPPDMAKKLAEQNPGGGPVDPNAPMFEMTQEAIELSSAPVESSLFVIPTGYHAIPADDLLKTIMSSQMAAMGVPQRQ
jgi:hypothetical protein